VIESARPFHLPRLTQPSGHRNGIPSFTVAGPRRFGTGLPFYPLAGHLSFQRYHTRRKDVNPAPANDERAVSNSWYTYYTPKGILIS
jgi:hypothetical protein